MNKGVELEKIYSWIENCDINKLEVKDKILLIKKYGSKYDKTIEALKEITRVRLFLIEEDNLDYLVDILDSFILKEDLAEFLKDFDNINLEKFKEEIKNDSNNLRKDVKDYKNNVKLFNKHNQELNKKEKEENFNKINENCEEEVQDSKEKSEEIINDTELKQDIEEDSSKVQEKTEEKFLEEQKNIEKAEHIQEKDLEDYLREEDTTKELEKSEENPYPDIMITETFPKETIIVKQKGPHIDDFDLSDKEENDSEEIAEDEDNSAEENNKIEENIEIEENVEIEEGIKEVKIESPRRIKTEEMISIDDILGKNNKEDNKEEEKLEIPDITEEELRELTKSADDEYLEEDLDIEGSVSNVEDLFEELNREDNPKVIDEDDIKTEEETVNNEEIEQIQEDVVDNVKEEEQEEVVDNVKEEEQEDVVEEDKENENIVIELDENDIELGFSEDIVAESNEKAIKEFIEAEENRYDEDIEKEAEKIIKEFPEGLKAEEILDEIDDSINEDEIYNKLFKPEDHIIEDGGPGETLSDDDISFEKNQEKSIFEEKEIHAEYTDLEDTE